MIQDILPAELTVMTFIYARSTVDPKLDAEDGYMITNAIKPSKIQEH